MREALEASTLAAGAKLGGTFAAEALLFYLAAYFATTLAAFGVVAVLSPADREAENLEDYDGLFRTRPWPATVFTAALLSLAGIPLTAGFVGKFAVFSAAFRLNGLNGMAGWLALVAIAMSAVPSSSGPMYVPRWSIPTSCSTFCWP